jgi:hypothetical protein
VFWEGDDGFVIVQVGSVVWTPQEGVSSVRGARLVDELDVVLLAFRDISSNTRSNFVSVAVELKVSVVGDDKDWVSCAFKQVVPVFQSSDYSEELPIIDRVSLFGGGEGL